MAFALVLAALLPALGSAQQFGHDSAVLDQAGVIDATTIAAIDRCLLELERKTTAEVRVLTVVSTKGRDIHSYAIEVAQSQRDHLGQKKRGLGKAGKDNGVLIVVAVKDRRYRFEVGEGLEGALPDLECDSIAQKCFVPNFRRGDYATGIYQAVVAVAQRIAAESGVQLEALDPAERPAPMPAERTQAGELEIIPCCCGLLVPLLIIMIVLGAVSSGRRRSSRRWGLGGGNFWQGVLLGQILSGGGRSRGGGWGSGWGGGWGGGFGGGGGFSGGGGGSFGGGGSSGGW